MPPVDGIRCYRGEADESWKMGPSIARKMKPGAEHQIVSELLVESRSEFLGDRSMFEKLVRAQHHGLPTRLLDVSLNPLMGLYFACNDDKQMDKDGKVIIFDFDESRMKFPDSDTVSIICNLANLRDDEKAALEKESKLENGRNATSLSRFRRLSPTKRLTQFVRIEKPYFLDLVDPADLRKYYFVYPPRNNARVIAQSGAFVIAGFLRYAAPERSKSLKLTKLKVPAECKPEILEQLDKVNINSMTMFPGIEFAAKYIKTKWTLQEAENEASGDK